MKTEKDIFNELMGELNAHQFHHVGYDNIRGNKMIMLHDVKFHESIYMQLCRDLNCIIGRIVWHVDNLHMYINGDTIKAINKMYVDNIEAMTNEIDKKDIGTLESKLCKINSVINKIVYKHK